MSFSPKSLLVVGVLAVALVAPAASQRFVRPVWPNKFTAEIDFSGSTWGRVGHRDTQYTLEADYERLAIRLEDYSTSSRWRAPVNLLRPLAFPRFGDNSTTEPELYHFELSADSRKCQYTSQYSRFDGVVGDFLDGSSWGSSSNKNDPRMWFPSHMRHIALPKSDRKNRRDGNAHAPEVAHLETTSHSSPVPFVPRWGNTWGSVDYCNGDWHENRYNQTLMGCDALRVITSRPSVYTHPLVQEIHRVHTRAYSSYDHDWEYHAKYDMKLSVAPAAFDLPANWRSLCRNSEQRLEFEPSASYHYVSPNSPLLIHVKLAAFPVHELGPVVFHIRHPDFIRVTPNRFTISAFDWEQPREILFEATALGSGRIVFDGRGGGYDLPGYSESSRSEARFEIVSRED